MGNDVQAIADIVTGNKLTMRKEIPYYKTKGPRRYFNRKEVEAWLQTNRASTDCEIADKAQQYCMNH